MIDAPIRWRFRSLGLQRPEDWPVEHYSGGPPNPGKFSWGEQSDADPKFRLQRQIADPTVTGCSGPLLNTHLLRRSKVGVNYFFLSYEAMGQCAETTSQRSEKIRYKECHKLWIMGPK